jgi:uncharacterized membrane protein YebE (DUF533 family)
MSLGNLIGQMLEQGLSGQTQTRARAGSTAQNLSAGGQGVEQILGSLQEMLGGKGPAGAGAAQDSPLAGFAEAAKRFLGQPQAAGMSGGQIGGLGALAGAVLGGGVGGAARGGAMALLGTLALSALRNAQGDAGGAVQPAGALPAAGRPESVDIEAVASEESERLVLVAMISAAKADGRIDEAEANRIMSHLNSEDVSEAERRFVLEEVRKPLDVAGLAASVRSPAQAAQVYAASLLAIDIDTNEERQYLRELASALNLDAGTVAYLHRTTGAPTA